MWEAFIHNNGYFIGDWGNSYGGTFLDISTNWRPDTEKHSRAIAVSLSLDIVTSLEDGDKHCKNVPKDEEYNMGRCLSKFFGNKIGCSIPTPFQGNSIPSELQLCHTAPQYEGNNAIFKFDAKPVNT